MPGPRFFAYCYRLTAYQGAVANRWRRQQAAAQHAASAPRTMSLAQWAEQHPHEMEAAYQRAAEGR